MAPAHTTGVAGDQHLWGENEIMDVHAARWVAVLGVVAAAGGTPSFAQSPAEFYKDKTVTFYVGLSAGLWAKDGVPAAAATTPRTATQRAAWTCMISFSPQRS